MYAFDEKKISESVLRLVFGFESPCNREVGDLVCKLIFLCAVVEEFHNSSKM